MSKFEKEFKEAVFNYGNKFGKCVICFKDIDEEETNEIRDLRQKVEILKHEAQRYELARDIRFGERLLKQILGREEAYEHWYIFHFKDGAPFICSKCFEKRFPPPVEEEEKPKDKG